jgi:hypothetical protein
LNLTGDGCSGIHSIAGSGGASEVRGRADREPSTKTSHGFAESLNEVIRDYLEKLAGAEDPERSIKEFEKLSARGHSRGWKFNRDDTHQRS